MLLRIREHNENRNGPFTLTVKPYTFAFGLLNLIYIYSVSRTFPGVLGSIRLRRLHGREYAVHWIKDPFGNSSEP